MIQFSFSSKHFPIFLLICPLAHELLSNVVFYFQIFEDFFFQRASVIDFQFNSTVLWKPILCDWNPVSSYEDIWVAKNKNKSSLYLVGKESWRTFNRNFYLGLGGVAQWQTICLGLRPRVCHLYTIYLRDKWCSHASGSPCILTRILETAYND